MTGFGTLTLGAVLASKAETDKVWAWTLAEATKAKGKEVVKVCGGCGTKMAAAKKTCRLCGKVLDRMEG